MVSLKCLAHVMRPSLAVLAFSSLLLSGCSSSNGASKSFTTDPPPPPPENELVLVTNNISNDISAYTMSTSNGTLMPVSGSPFSTQDSGGNLAVDPQGRFVYIAELGNSATGSNATGVWAFSITPGTGVLTPVAGGLFTGDPASSTQSVVEDPSGRFVYTANMGAYGVWAFSINSTTGALSQISGSPYAPSGGCTSLVMNPAGTFLYALCSGPVPTSDILGFSVDATTGALTALAGSPFPVPQAPSELFMHPSGAFLYVADLNHNAIDGYAISANGSLTAVPGSPFPGGTEPQTLAITPSGKFLYSASWQTGDVYGYSVDSTTGSLTPLTGSPYVLLPSLTGIAVDPTGQFLLIGDSALNVVYEVPIDLNTGGAGTPTTFPAGTYADGVAVIKLP